MAEQSGVEAPVKAPAAADSFAEHKRIRAGEKVPVETTPAEPKNKSAAPAKGDNSEPAQGESAEASGTSNKESQESKDKKDKSAAGRITEAEEREAKARQKSADVRAALAKAKAAEEEADRLEQELANKAKPGSTPAKAEPKSAAAAAEDPKPKLADFTAKADTYEEALEKWEEASSDWRDRQRKKQSEQTEQQARQAKTREAHTRRLNEAHAKYEDFDAVTAGDMKAGTGLILTPPMINYVLESDHGLDVAYYLGKNRAEYDRIFVLQPTRQLVELGKIEDKIAVSKSSSTPENKQPAPVSKVTPPPRIVSGSEPASEKKLAEANSMDEHRRLRKAQRSA